MIYINLNLSSQSYSFNYLNNELGLPSNEIHITISDHKGFIWIGTSNGLCRWDSKNFKYYTIEDGLPNNEVYRLYDDRKGRIWITTFSNKICYYDYNLDKIITEKDSPILSNIEIFHNSNIIIKQEEIYYLNKQNWVHSFNFKTKKHTDYHSVSTFQNIILSNNELYTIDLYLGDYLIRNLKGQIILSNIKNIKLINDNLVLINKKNEFNIFNSTQLKYEFSQILNKNFNLKDNIISNYIHSNNNQPNNLVSYLIQDKYIFIFSKNGFYWKNSPLNIQNIYINKDINSIYCIKNDIYYNSNGNLFKNNRFIVELSSSLFYHSFKSDYNLFFTYSNPVLKYDYIQNTLSTIVKNKKVDFHNLKDYLDPSFKMNFYKNTNAKFYFKIDSINFLSTYNALYKEKNDTFRLILNKKTYTTFLDSKNRLWYTNLDGLFYTKDYTSFIKNKIKVNFNNQNNIFVNSILEDKYKNLIFATNQGIYILDSNFNYHKISKQNFLNSNECKTIKLDPIDNSLWIATNNGLTNISYINKKGLIYLNLLRTYLKVDGLISNEINDFDFKGDSLYIATTQGLDLVLNRFSRPDTFKIPLYINQIKVNQKEIDFKQTINLCSVENNISIDLSAIYFQRRDRLNLTYKLYRNKELIAENQLLDNKVELLSLKNGKYKLILSCYDKDYSSIKSEPLFLNFTINPPFYTTWWFWILSIILGSGIVGIIVYKEDKRKKTIELEKANLNTKINQYKLQGLQQQMNPHFIFNSMSTIQNLILKDESANALDYISDFSGLMRKMLDNSRQELISLANELEFIKQYVSLELIRFKDSFQVIYQVNLNDIQPEEIKIPTMMIQPIIENAIKHGVSNLKTRKGIITICFELIEEYKLLKISIQDNGDYHNVSIPKQGHISTALKVIEERLLIYTKNNLYGTYSLEHNLSGSIANLTIPI